MAVERYCEIRFNQIVNTILVDPETEQGQGYLETMEVEGHVLMPEADAIAQYPYA